MDAPVMSPQEEKGAMNRGLRLTYSNIHPSCTPPFLLTTAPIKAWCALSAQPYQWVQLEAYLVVDWTRVETKARDGGSWHQRVKTYQVKYSEDGTTWRRAIVKGSTTLQGNTDARTSKINVFDPPLKAKFIRIIEMSWHGHPSMKFEAYYKLYYIYIYIYIFI